MPDQVINIILEPGATDLHLFDFLVGRKVDFFFDSINSVIEPMIFVKHCPEVIVAAFETANDITILRELAENGMMKVHILV